MFHIADVNLRLILPTLLKQLLEDFVNTDDRHKQIPGVFDGGSEKIGIAAFCKYFSQPEESTIFIRDPLRRARCVCQCLSMTRAPA